MEETKKIIIDPRLAYQITSMMEGVIKRGTAKRLKDLNLYGYLKNVAKKQKPIYKNESLKGMLFFTFIDFIYYSL